MDQTILEEIGRFCREAGVAESTFGRLAVNDGKLISRIRNGGRITTDTLDRLRSYMSEHRGASARAAGDIRFSGAGLSHANSAGAPQAVRTNGQRPFRFFDNRQKYLLFVNTCSEKWEVAERIDAELDQVRPQPPALRVFDAGVGDGTVLARVMRSMHARHPTVPFYIAGKEISLEDVRLCLEKMPDRFMEHPASVVVLTNLYYAEAPWLMARSPADAHAMVWREVSLKGSSSHGFEEQITALAPFLGQNWTAHSNPKSGNPSYDRPVVLVLYREDHRLLLDSVIPRRGAIRADYDLVIASQPYRARASAAFKAKRVIAPLARALAPGGHLVGIHSCGGDPGMEVINAVWPDDKPFETSRHDILKAVKHDLGAEARDFRFHTGSDNAAVFRYVMHTLPNELSGSIGTSTLYAAWNAAIYVAQVEDERLSEVVKDNRYLVETDKVLKRHGGLWFNDEAYVISRRPR